MYQRKHLDIAGSEAPRRGSMKPGVEAVFIVAAMATAAPVDACPQHITPRTSQWPLFLVLDRESPS